MDRTKSKTQQGPTYAWQCSLCHAPNPACQASCRTCGFAATFSGSELVNARKRRYGRAVPVDGKAIAKWLLLLFTLMP